MASNKLQPSVLLLLLAVFLPAVAAHNITVILSESPNFGTFNSLLSKTSIAAEINRRQSITVLALDDSATGAISGLPDKTLSQVLSIHVILDYYDATKIHALKRRSTLFTTLFQTTGVAKNNMGFLNFTRQPDGQLAFGSAVPDGQLVANYVKEVATKPYNISVLQISTAIVPPGINSAATAPFGAPIAVKPEPLVPSPAQVDDDAEAEDSESESPADGPDADGSAADEANEGSLARRVAGVSLISAAGVAFLAL